MKYSALPKLMWMVFKKDFKKQLTETFNESNPKQVMKNAHLRYKEILAGVDEFKKGDRFLMNILSCAMLSSILLTVENKYDLETVRVYYRKVMCENTILKSKAKKSKSYTLKGREKLKKSAEESMSNENPYSWKFTVEDGKTLNQYVATFYTCGICYLMRKLGLEEYIPAMCSLDYDMARLNNTKFTREFTLASGGKYCDCHYDHQTKKMN
jgi:hypothetical protein